MRTFEDRRDAGRRLAEALAANRSDAVVLGLARGGVPVGYEVAHALGLPLDALIVRKLGVPGYEELAMGAVASGGARVVDRRIVELAGIDDAEVEAVIEREQREVARREAVLRGGRPPADVAGLTAILVDDGLATGSTMLVAVRATRARGPAAIVVAVPVGAPEVCERLRGEADEVVCLVTPQRLGAVGLWYEDFAQLSDDEVREMLERAARESWVRAEVTASAEGSPAM